MLVNACKQWKTNNIIMLHSIHPFTHPSIHPLYSNTTFQWLTVKLPKILRCHDTNVSHHWNVLVPSFSCCDLTQGYCTVSVALIIVVRGPFQEQCFRHDSSSMKISSCSHPSCDKWSLWNFAHGTTAQLSCHVQNFIVIWYPTMELH